jgi:hypothetical protein
MRRKLVIGSRCGFRKHLNLCCVLSGLRLLKALDRAQEPLPKEALEEALNARWSEFE